MAKKTKDDEEPKEQPKAEASDGSIAVNDAWTGMLAVSLLALVVGTGFLAYDYMQYSEGEPPKVTKFTSTPPGAPPKANPPPKAVEQPKVDADKKDPDKKDPEKKDA